jgi:hypothetical protein
VPHTFDPGYVRQPFASLCDQYPGPDVYPVGDFRIEWGPIFHRGRLDGSARVLVIGQDPGVHESIARRILVGEAGQRIQGFLGRLGIERSCVMVNAFLYSVYGQSGGERHRTDPAIAAYRNRWLDGLLLNRPVEAVVALGSLADAAWTQWAAIRPNEAHSLAYRRIIHPTFPESASAAGQTTHAAAMKEMLQNWNEGLDEVAPAIRHPDVERPLHHYGDALDEERDLAPIPSIDLPAGIPVWMRSLDPWAERRGADADAKRATLVVTVPPGQRPWSEPT